MTASFWFLLCGYAVAAWTLFSRVGLNLSLSSIALILMFIFHGPAYFFYTRAYGPETDFFHIIISAARGHDVISTLDIALAITFINICAGIMVVDLLSGVGKVRWRNAIDKWAVSPLAAPSREVRRVKFLGFALAFLVLIPYVFVDDQIPKALNYFKADLSEFEKIALRREGGGGSSYLYNLLLSNLLPFLSFVYLGLVYAKAQISRFLAVSLIVMIAIGKAATLSKAPLAIYALQCATMWLILRRLTLSYVDVLVFVCLSLGLFLVMSWVANPSVDELFLILEFLFYRVFMIVNESLLEYFSAIPHALAHSWGSNFGWIASLSGEERQLPVYWLVAEVHRGVFGSTTTAMFMGDAWAEFAWSGVIACALLMGMLIRFIDLRLIIRQGKSAVSAGALALGHYGLFIAMSTAFQTALFTGGLALVIPIVYLLTSRLSVERSLGKAQGTLDSV
jgi:hypothetical protein